MGDASKDGKPVHVLLGCSCNGLNHALQLTFFPKGRDAPSLHLSTVMPYPKPLRQRLWMALKYVWKNDDCGYLGYEHVFTTQGAALCKQTLETALRQFEKHGNYWDPDDQPKKEG